MAEIIFKLTVMASLVVKITCAVTEITFLGADIILLVAKITFVVIDISFKLPLQWPR